MNLSGLEIKRYSGSEALLYAAGHFTQVIIYILWDKIDQPTKQVAFLAKLMQKTN